jgi:hypothetical protein
MKLLALVAFLTVMYTACFLAYQFGTYSQMYSTRSNDIYMVAYAEGTVEQQIMLRLAAEYRCDGELQEDFSCKWEHGLGAA